MLDKGAQHPCIRPMLSSPYHSQFSYVLLKWAHRHSKCSHGSRLSDSGPVRRPSPPGEWKRCGVRGISQRRNYMSQASNSSKGFLMCRFLGHRENLLRQGLWICILKTLPRNSLERLTLPTEYLQCPSRTRSLPFSKMKGLGAHVSEITVKFKDGRCVLTQKRKTFRKTTHQQRKRIVLEALHHSAFPLNSTACISILCILVEF